MSINIVSTISSQAPAAVGDSTSSTDSILAAQDFASLLLGQLSPIVPTILSENSSSSELPLAKVAPDDTVPSDAASILASLGIFPAQTALDNDTVPSAGESSQDIGEVSQTYQRAIAPSPLATETDPRLSTERVVIENSFAKAITSSATDQKPANIAASGLTALKDDSTTDIGTSNAAVFKIDSALPTSSPTAVKVDSEAVIATSSLAASKDAAPDVAAPMESTPDIIPANHSSAPIGTNVLPSRHEASLSIATSIREQDWAHDFSQKITWLATNDKQTAQITLNPAQMGPIEISLNMDKGSATASFVSASAEVRDAIETAMPRLREMFASAGIELGQTNVSSESFRQQSSNGAGDSNHQTAKGIADIAILGTESTQSLQARAFSTQRVNGMVDIFA